MILLGVSHFSLGRRASLCHWVKHLALSPVRMSRVGDAGAGSASGLSGCVAGITERKGRVTLTGEAPTPSPLGE